MSIDMRTRDGAVEPPPVDPEAFFDADLPDLFARAAGLVAPGLSLLDPAPVAIEVGDRSWLLEASGTGEPHVTAETGRRGAAAEAGRLRLTPEQLHDLVHDQVTVMGLFSAGRIDVSRVRLDHVLHWWLALRSALDQVPVHTPGAVETLDADGRPLDLKRSFDPDDDRAEMARFLEAAGFLHVRGMYTESEMRQVELDMDAAAPDYSPGDGRSWWARTDGGVSRLVRMQYFDRKSETVAAMLDDDRFQSLAGLPGCGHVARPHDHTNRIEALFKPLGVVEGISDVPWHKDCSLGRHSYECCGITVGFSVTGAGPDSGQLRVIAGSHRALVWPALLQPGLDLEEVELPTERGDVTLHLSCTLHMAQPPTERERRVMYTSFTLPPVDAGATSAARRRLGALREAAPVSVSQPAAR